MAKNCLIKKIVGRSLLALGAMVGVNTIAFRMTENDVDHSREAHALYNGRFGGIYYTKSGKGSPVLLLHDLSYTASSMEWNRLVEKLSQNNTVYCMDLPGCGRSEKEAMTYTNYIYVQAVADYINAIIGGRCDVITSGRSSSIALMTALHNPSLIGKIIMINPESLDNIIMETSGLNKFWNALLKLPIIGTFYYVLASSKMNIYRKMKGSFSARRKITDELLQNASNTARSGGANARFAYASQVGNYTKASFVKALKTIEQPIYIIAGEKEEDIQSRLDGYKHFNPDISIDVVNGAKSYPHIEKALKVSELCQKYLSE